MPPLEHISIEDTGLRLMDMTESRLVERKFDGVMRKVGRHLTHADIYALIAAGHTISVTEKKSGKDVTAKTIVATLLLCRPEKLSELSVTDLIAIARK